MTSSEIRQSFFDFFASKQHTIVPSASLMPQSPGLLFTNAGMNQFVPYFLGTEKAPYSPARAADTQKCIRAGGKHNDLEDVGYDTYHHTFFEMLGNWSFGDYFKKEAIAWAWELVVEQWGVPANRLYATVYFPSEGDPSEFDQEAYDLWAVFFEKAGLDPKVHIVNGNVKDNFWMMGDTGPCGPCSELHVDLTPNADSQGKLVNLDSDLCIEIWNLVFIQYNAEADGSFRDLPAKHVDTGMGFERVASLIQNTKGFTDFSEKPTNYATDIFQPIFRTLEQLSGKTYVDVYPNTAPSEDSLLTTHSSQLSEAIAFRVIADHIRTLSFSIADGILPGNTGRNYVLRRILRRAVKYGRTLGFEGSEPFLPKLVDTLVAEFAHVFPELKKRAAAIKETLATEENSFNQTLDRGMEQLRSIIFKSFMDWLMHKSFSGKIKDLSYNIVDGISFTEKGEKITIPYQTHRTSKMYLEFIDGNPEIEGNAVFELYDTYGFPVDLTQLIARENQFSIDSKGFEALMEKARELSRSAQKSTVVRALDLSTDANTEFVGFENDTVEATILEVHEQGSKALVITDKTVLFTEMGGQDGDTGTATIDGQDYLIEGVQKIGNAVAHIISDIQSSTLDVGRSMFLSIDGIRRRLISSHHTATHLLHWALHEVVSPDASQQGSSVTPDRLRFDFNSKALTPEQITAIEEKVNAAIDADATVSWIEVPHADVKDNSDIIQFFGDKYGDLVRVVQIGGEAKALNGYSMELCGGTHVTKTGEIGLFKIKSEGAIASGVRRIEALCGQSAWNWITELAEKGTAEEKQLRDKLNQANHALIAAGQSPIEHAEFPHIMGALLVEGGDSKQISATVKHYQTHLATLREAVIESDKALKKAQAAGAADIAKSLLEDVDFSTNLVLCTEGPAVLLQELINGLKQRQFAQAAFCIVDDGAKLHLGALCGDSAKAAGLMAGKLIQTLAPIAGGKGGGKPDMARGAASERSKVSDLEAATKKALGL